MEKKQNEANQEHAQVLSSSPSVEAQSNEIDHVAEQKLVRKLDRHILPIVMLLYVFSFLDRYVTLSILLSHIFLIVKSVNIGNARLYGLEEDLGLKANQYQTALSLLFITYALFEVPSNLVLKKFTPSRWIAFITTVSYCINPCTIFGCT